MTFTNKADFVFLLFLHISHIASIPATATPASNTHHPPLTFTLCSASQMPIPGLLQMLPRFVLLQQLSRAQEGCCRLQVSVFSMSRRVVVSRRSVLTGSCEGGCSCAPGACKCDSCPKSTKKESSCNCEGGCSCAPGACKCESCPKK